MVRSSKNRLFLLQVLFFFIVIGISLQCEDKMEADQVKPHSPAQLNPDSTQAGEWLRQGLTQQDAAHYQKAMVCLNKADTIYQKLLANSRDSLLLSAYLSTTNNRAKTLSRMSQTDSALTVIDQAIAWGKSKFLEGSLETAKSLYVKGSIFLDKGRYSDASAWYQQGLDEFDRIGYGQHLDAAVCGSFLGLMMSYRDIDSGYEQITDAVTIAASAKDTLDPRVADVYHLYASVLQAKFGTTYALEYMERALHIKLLHYGPNHLSVSKTYNNMANAYFYVGDYTKALELHRINQGIREQLSPVPHRRLASTYLNIGIIYERLQEYDEALKYYEQAYQHSLESVGPDHLQSLRVSYAMIAVLKNKGHYRQAIKRIKENVGSFNETLSEDPGLAASHYDILGSIYLQLQLLDSAYQYTFQGLEAKISYYGENSYPVAASYDHMGKVLAAQKSYREAIEYYQRGRKIFQQTPEKNPDAFVYTLSNFALCHADLLEFDEALRYIQEGIELLAIEFSYESLYDNPPLNHEPVQNPYLLWFVANSKGSILHQKFLQTQNKEDALACLKTYYWADSLLTSLRSDLFWEGSRADLVGGDARQGQNSAVSFAGQAYAISQDTTYLDMCFYFMERSRALLLTEAVESRTFAPQSLKPWFEEEKKLKKTIHEVERNLEEIQGGEEPEKTQVSSLQDTIFQLKEQYVGHIESLRLDQPEYYDARFQPQRPKLQELQDLLVDDSTLLIEYQLGVDELIVLGIDNRNTSLHRQSLEPQFFDQLAAFRAHHQAFQPGSLQSDLAYAEKCRDFVRLSHAIYDTLLSDVLASRPYIKKLIIIPQGELGYLPFDLLLSQEVEGEDYRSLPYLLKDYTIRYEYSAGFVMAPTKKEPEYTDFVGFAPSYDGQGFLADLEEKDSAQLAISFPSLRGNVQTLLFNEAEVAEVAGLMEGYALIGQQATKAAFTARSKKANILHLAMHAFVNDTFPAYSHLVFASPSTAEKNTKLFAYDLYNMEFEAQLAVLSACQTGAGKIIDGEGIMSLSRAFKYAGCPNIVTSLWKVHDKNSKDLMVDFYANLKKGWGKAEALRQAKLTFLTQCEERFTDPFYWGTFILIGDDLPVTITDSKSPLWLWIGGLLFGCLLLIGWTKLRA